MKKDLWFYRITILVLAIFIVAVWAVSGILLTANATERRWSLTAKEPLPAPADINSIALGNNQFALQLYSKLSNENKNNNLFFSPYSISTALAMTYPGARGNTEKQMAEVLHFTLPQDRLHQAFGLLEKGLNEQGKQGVFELTVAIPSRGLASRALRV